MTYDLEFNKQALKEWKKLGSTVREQFKKKLKERLENPKFPSAKLTGTESLFKIKLRQSGYRLVYQVIDDRVVVIVLSVGKRERLEAYKNAFTRLEE
ncbi:type II toxin-antitoxin system RelE/ParE family toxin [Halodesulfovibrio sp.]|jgi:mRNA interferase RelE/StbE|uniref:type II toxin-antitoxin system RelE family toxin n=1 Tax=Halodesulfovibrio sp. TaxID=1912772 RepID=UPI0025D45D7D|nr:type II toxin-antitoxin system RelE/ParE family toxin [Halodesulfovibrio sp.]MCT4625855.1 type II toxin-antitoxin system RelE/ParE family toxin [Halodesulfovibrio sp.]